MCNAWNHSSGCTCGFGPPYAVWGRLRLAKEEEWTEGVITSKNSLIRGMKEVGFTPREIGIAIKQYRKLPKKKHRVKSWLKNKLSQREYIDVKSRVQFVIIPLFRLHLPEIDGVKVEKSRITYQESEFIETKQNWSFRIQGIGMGHNRLVRVLCSSKAVAENGQCKLIYVKIPIRVTEVAVIQKNQPITSFLRAEIDPALSNIAFHNGTKICNKKLCKKDEDIVGPPSDLFPLADSTRGYVGTYTKQWNYRSGRKQDIDIHAFGMKVTMNAYIYRGYELTFQFELPGGYDYLLMPLNNYSGFKWRLNETGEWKERDLLVHNIPQQAI